MTAINRIKARDTIVQMNALRVAAWGDEETVQRFAAALGNQPSAESNDTDAALAAFGLKRE